MAELSPMMRQYLEVKSRHEDCLLFFRVGDFYEMFFEDAKTASEELDLVLTGKDCGMEERAPMCGVPFHSCDSYIARLVAKGYKVAICEQMEDPATAKGLVKRDIIRIVTPGTVLEDNMLEESSHNYLAAVSHREGEFGLAFSDVSTGECLVTAISGADGEERTFDELMRFSPSELLTDGFEKECPKLRGLLKERYEGTLTLRPAAEFDAGETEPLFLRNFSVNSAVDLGLPDKGTEAAAVGAILCYLRETGVGGQWTVQKITRYTESQFMHLDLTAVRNLELCETLRSKAKKGSLLWVLDKTVTAMGKRMIRSWVEKPLLSITEIVARQNGVEELLGDTWLRGEATEYMRGIRDVERLMARVVYGNANPKDLLNLAVTVRRFPLLKDVLKSARSRMLGQIRDQISPLTEVADLIESAIREEAPLTLREGNIICTGYNSDLDLLRRDMNDGTGTLAEIEARERERTGIKNLRVRYNKVFGYYIEVTNSFLDMVPEDYIRKQTLTNAERFITEELKTLETRVLSSKDRSIQLEYELFCDVRNRVAAHLEEFQQTAEAIAKLDVLCSFAKTACENNYCKPLVNAGGTIRITDGRHPVVEQVIDKPFVSNNTLLDSGDNRCAVITGPNMAGKSTYMRQVALIVLMAQIGSFVPAESAEIGLVDAIFTRVGASDDLARGQSTFMVEMNEVAEILKNATKNSLLILDEIGRGTSTFDGMAIARAVLEYAADKRKLGAKTLFATHYHELTAMEQELSGVRNYNIAVKKRGDDIFFLRRIVPGGADESYGIEVAKLGGIPDPVIRRAKEILKKTLAEGVVTYRTAVTADSQLPMEIQGASELLEELRVLDVNTLTPIEAMGILFDLANKAKSF